MPKRPTQTDVAQLAGVSRATVSYVLNKRTGGRIHITQETRHKVLAAAQELGYEPHALAQSLRSGLTHMIGLLIPDTQNPHYFDVLSGVEDATEEHDYHLMIVSAGLDPRRERRCLQALLQQRLDGLVLIPTFIDLFQEELQTLKDHASSIVLARPQEKLDYVYVDSQSGAGMLMDHLISRGHMRIGLINGGACSGLSEDKLQVYRTKIAEIGISVDEQLVLDCGHTVHDGYLAAQELLGLESPPTAIWAINDLLAVGALHAVHERGLRIPDDISVAGFDDIALASQLYPPLTTVCTYGKEFGRRAAEVLLHRILVDPDQENVQESISVELVVRQSTGPVPVA